MAYESKITNKRFGTTFAGQPQFDRNSPLGDIVDSIRQTTPQFQRLATKVKSDAEVAAEEKYQALIALGKNPDIIEAEIKKGLHPELNNVYSAAIVNTHRGRFDAAKVQATLVEHQDEFNPDEQAYDDWAVQYLPENLDQKGTHYNKGFSAIYDQYRSDKLIEEATYKHNQAVIRKTNNGVQLMNTIPYDEIATRYFPTLNTLNTEVVHVDGTKGDYYTTTELNNIAVTHATNLGNKAQSVEEIDYAIRILTTDRGKGKGGNNIGSLLNTEDTKIAQLYGSLMTKRNQLLEKKRTDDRTQKETDFNDILTKSLTAVLDGTFGDIKLEMQQAVVAIDPKFFDDFTRLTSADYKGSATVNQNYEFEMKAIAGGFKDANAILAEALIDGIAPNSVKQALAYNAEALNKRNSGVLPIEDTNVHYKKLIGELATIVDINMITGEISGLGILDDAEGNLLRFTENYVTTSIYEAEQKWKKDELSDDEIDAKRKQLATDLETYVFTRVGKNTKGTDLNPDDNSSREEFFKDEVANNVSFADIQEDRATIARNVSQLEGALDINDTFENNMAKIAAIFTDEDNKENYIDLFEQYVPNLNNQNVGQVVEDVMSNQGLTEQREFVMTGVRQLIEDSLPVARKIMEELEFIDENSSYQDIQEAGIKFVEYIVYGGKKTGSKE
jgi:hypothetical protein